MSGAERSQRVAAAMHDFGIAVGDSLNQLEGGNPSITERGMTNEFSEIFGRFHSDSESLND